MRGEGTGATQHLKRNKTGLKAQSTYFDHLLYVAFNKTSSLENASDDMNSDKKISFIFNFITSRQGPVFQSRFSEYCSS